MNWGVFLWWKLDFKGFRGYDHNSSYIQWHLYNCSAIQSTFSQALTNTHAHTLVSVALGIFSFPFWLNSITAAPSWTGYPGLSLAVIWDTADYAFHPMCNTLPPASPFSHTHTNPINVPHKWSASPFGWWETVRDEAQCWIGTVMQPHRSTCSGTHLSTNSTDWRWGGGEMLERMDWKLTFRITADRRREGLCCTCCLREQVTY